jgi:hypothetical protein
MNSKCKYPNVNKRNFMTFLTSRDKGLRDKLLNLLW